jgi:hypothetical protein
MDISVAASFQRQDAMGMVIRNDIVQRVLMVRTNSTLDRKPSRVLTV